MVGYIFGGNFIPGNSYGRYDRLVKSEFILFRGDCLMNLCMIEGKYFLAYSQNEALRVAGAKDVVVSIIMRGVATSGVPRQVTAGEARELISD